MHRRTVHGGPCGPRLALVAAIFAVAGGSVPVATAQDAQDAPVDAGDAVDATTPSPDDASGRPPTRADRLVERLQQPLPPGEGVTGVSPQLDRGSFVAKVLERAAVRDRPGGARTLWTVGPTTMHTGNATRLMVLGARFDQAGRAWLRVQIPVRPNGRAGWVRADEVRIESSNVFVRVRLESRTVSVYRDGRLWSRSRAVIGAPETPTPRGLFAIYETASQGGPDGFLGSWALHLTAFSEVLDNYGGGPGRAAIHGRGPESIADASLGEAKSHGCVRVPNRFVDWLRLRAPAGTPVQITLR